MNDIVSRFLEVLDSEENAYWSFCAFMSKVSLTFSEEGLRQKIDLEEQLLKKLDPELHAHVTKIDVDRLTFCHRWLLLGFQREFRHQEALRLFEILSSNHLEMNSFEAEKTRCLERLSCIQQKGGDACIQLSPIKTNFTFELFVCAAILLEHKDTLLKCCNEMDLILFTSSLQNKLSLNPILEKAEELFFNYCTGTVLECFRKYYLKPQKRMSGMFLLKNVLLEKTLTF
ncbi:TBC1 domain family member 17-like [Protopterus annectens]|uniref:TBC1 domain family member 17-like n=1 Tax=Protopterus annectens TaxID=7888 RepID=UPI001CFA2FBD|nr:TBC1 domain family member 17-like [Protopterus annectens]